MVSPVGPLLIGASERGLVCVQFGERPPATLAGAKAEWRESAAQTAHYVAELEQYFARQRRTFSMALDLRGTDFQKRCWKALLQIPYGETRTYADIARAVGSPHAFRAVGLANHDNPLAIVVPCHRVLASDGSLCGYGGGLDVKRRLLELEGASAVRSLFAAAEAGT